MSQLSYQIEEPLTSAFLVGNGEHQLLGGVLRQRRHEKREIFLFGHLPVSLDDMGKERIKMACSSVKTNTHSQYLFFKANAMYIRPTNCRHRIGKDVFSTSKRRKSRFTIASTTSKKTISTNNERFEKTDSQ